MSLAKSIYMSQPAANFLFHFSRFALSLLTMFAIFLVIVTLNKVYPSDNYIPAPGNF